MPVIPDTLRIGPVTYRVRLEDQPLDDANDRVMGQVRNTEAVIRLDNSLGYAALYQTLWHEILHALIYQDQMHKVALGEERAVDRLAWGVAQVLRDNPALAKMAAKL